MGQPGHATAVTPHGQIAQNLKSYPEDQKDPGANPDDGDEESEKDQGFDLGGRKEDEVGAQDAGNRSAGADHWNLRIPVCGYVAEGGDDAAQEIEKQKADFPQHVFNVVAEYPEVQHVPGQMREAGM